MGTEGMSSTLNGNKVHYKKRWQEGLGGGREDEEKQKEVLDREEEPLNLTLAVDLTLRSFLPILKARAPPCTKTLNPHNNSQGKQPELHIDYYTI